MSQGLTTPYRAIAKDVPVNPAGSWRFRCPDGHTSIVWSTVRSVYCDSCNTGYAVGEIRDLKSERSLAVCMREHGDAAPGRDA